MNSMKDKLFLIDTNILVYAYTDSDPQKQKMAVKLLEKCWKKNVKYAISLQNLGEFFFVLTRKSNNIPSEHIAKIVSDVLHFSQWTIVQYNGDTLLKAMRSSNGKNFWDAVIAETMLQNNITSIYTENVSDFQKFDNIIAINPFI